MNNNYEELEKFLNDKSAELKVYFCDCTNSRSSYVKNGNVLALEDSRIVLSVFGQKNEADLIVQQIKSKIQELGFSVILDYDMNGGINNYTLYFHK